MENIEDGFTDKMTIGITGVVLIITPDNRNNGDRHEQHDNN